MQVSAQKMDPQLEQEILEQLALVLGEVRTASEAALFLRDFFSVTERTVLAKRLAIAVLLRQGKSYEAIKSQLKVSSATISYVAELLEKEGVEMALQKIEDENWAEKHANKILKFFK